MDLKQFRKQYPAYNDWSDQELATGLHKQYYSDMPFETFAGQIGYKPPAKEETPAAAVEAPAPKTGIAAVPVDVEGATPEATKRRTGIADVLYNTVMSPIGLLSGVDVNAPEVKGDSPFFSALGKSVTRFKQSNALNQLAELENLRNIVDKQGALTTRPGTREEQLERLDKQLLEKKRDIAEYGMESKAIEDKFGKNKFTQKYDALTDSPAYKDASLPKQMAMTGELYIKDLPGLASYARDIGAENFLSAVPTIVSAVAARFAGFGTTGAAVTGGSMSAMNEFGNQYAELRAQGKSHEDAWVEAGIKSSVIGLFDAASFKSAGNALNKIVENSIKKAPLKETIKEVGKETGKQAGFGAAGEGFGSVAINQPVNLRNLLDEALGETVGAPAEALTTYGQKKTKATQPTGTPPTQPKFEIDPQTGVLRPVQTETTTETTQAAPLTKQGELFTKEEAPYQVTPGEGSVEAQARQEQSDRAQEQIAVLNQQLAQTTDPQQAATIRDDISKLEPLVQQTGQQKATSLGNEFVTLYRKGTALGQQRAELEQARDAEKTLDGKAAITEQIKAIDSQIEQVVTRQEEISAEGKKLEKEGVTFDRTKDDLDLKGPSPIVNKKVLAKFGLAPKAPIRQELLNLDMTDPEDRQKFIDAVDKHTIKKAKIDMTAVEEYINAFEQRQETPVEQTGTELSPRAEPGTSQPSLPMPSGRPGDAPGVTTPQTQGLDSTVPTAGGPTTGTGTLSSDGTSPLNAPKVERTITGETTDAMQQAAAEGNLRLVLEEIAKNTSGKFNALEQLIARRLMSVPGLLPKIRIVDPSVLVDENGKQAAGQYVPRTDTIEIARGQVDSHTVLHEAVHGYLHALIIDFQAGEISNKGLTDLNTLFETLKKDYPNLLTDPRTKYGMESLTEFASEMMSNRVFQDVLSGIEYRSSNAFTEFARNVLRILGISPSKNFTALAAGLIAADRSLATGRQYQETRVTDKTAMGAVPVQRTPEAEKAEKDSEGFKTSAGPVPKAGFFKRTLNKMQAIREGNLNAGSMFGNLQNFAANNQAFLNLMRKETLELEKKGSITHAQAEATMLGLIGAQITQRAQLAVQMMDRGNWKYDPITNTYDPITDKDNMDVFGDLANSLAKRLGVNPEVALGYIDDALEANRLQSVDDKLIKAKTELTRAEKRIEFLENDVKRQKAPAGTRTAVEQRAFDRTENARVEVARKELSLKKELAKELTERIELYTDQMMHKDRANIASGMRLYNNHPEIKEATRVFNVMRERSINLMVETGLLTREKAETWLDEAAYVPFFRDVESVRDEAQQIMTKGLRETMAPLRAKYKGSMEEVTSVTSNMRQWMQWALAGSISNRQIKRMLDQYKAYLPDEVREGRDPAKGNFTVMENGVERVYNVDSPEIAQAFVQQGAYIYPLMSIAKGVSDIARKNITRIPLFSVGQIPADLYAAMFTSGIRNPGALVVRLLSEAVKTSVGMSQTRKDLVRRGLLSTHEYNAQLDEDSIKYAQDIVPPSAYRRVMHLLDRFGAVSENIIRQAVYNQLRSEGATPQKAETAVVEIMNFRNKSGIKGVNSLSSSVIFFNSYLQSAALILKTLSGKGITYQTRAQGLATLGIVSAKIATFSFLLAALSDMADDEDEYAKRSRAAKNRIFNIPGTDGMGLAVREDMYVLPHILAQYAYRAMFREIENRGVDMKSFKGSLKNIALNTLVPPSEGVPQLFKPTIEGALGVDIHTGRDIIPEHMRALEPELQFNATTAEYAKAIGAATGTSPLMIEHFVKGYFGTTAQLFDMLFGGLIADARDIPRPARSTKEVLAKLPSVGASFSKEENMAVAEDLYEAKKDFDRALKTYKKLNESDSKAAEEYRKENKDLMLNPTGAVKQLEALKRRENYIRNLPSREKNPEKGMSAEEKAAELQRLKEIKERLVPIVRDLRIKAKF